jgi:hypothetical protein
VEPEENTEEAKTEATIKFVVMLEKLLFACTNPNEDEKFHVVEGVNYKDVQVMQLDFGAMQQLFMHFGMMRVLQRTYTMMEEMVRRPIPANRLKDREESGPEEEEAEDEDYETPPEEEA